MPQQVSVMNRGGYSQVISRDFKKVFFEEYAEQVEEFSSIFNTKTMDGAYDRHGMIAGLGSMYKIGEGEAIPQESFLQGNEKTIYPESFGLALAISEEVYTDDKTGIMKKGFQELGRAAARTKEILAWDVLNSGFVTTVRTGIDGGALFSDHNLVGGGTYSNVGVSAAMSNTSLKAALTVFDKMVNERGYPTPVKPAMLITSPDKRDVAETYIKNEYDPEASISGLINTVGNKGLNYFISHYLTSTTAWFIVTDKKRHDLTFFMRKPLDLLSWDEPRKRISVFQADMRCTADFVNWYGTYGNAGA